MFQATHYLITPNGKTTEVCLEKSPDIGWSWVRTALDWFSGESIIQYHQRQGLQSQGVPLVGFSLEPISEDNLKKEKIKNEKNPVKLPNMPVAIAGKPYSLRDICKRLKCGDRLVFKMRSSPEFTQWTQSRDPDGLIWEYREGKYWCLENS
jgi:hypothetical protein